MYINKEEIYPAYISRHNSTREKQIILLIVLNEEKEIWRYLALKRLSALLHGITQKRKSDFYCLSCPHCFRTENTLKPQKKYVKDSLEL